VRSKKVIRTGNEERETVATQEFNCPNCGAPLDYDGSGATIRCPYCETSVVVPAELRPQAVRAQPVTPAPVQPPAITIDQLEAVSTTARRGVSCLASAVLLGVILFVAAMIAIPILLTRRASQMASKVNEPTPVLATGIGPTEVPLPTPIPFASLVATFGSQGIGPGLLNDSRYITVDGSGTVYVADYEDGRIQAFDADGKFLHGWQVGDANTIIYGMAASPNGILYVAYGGYIYRYDGSRGKLLDKLDYANGPEFGDLATLPDGGVLGAWYQARWGLITSLEGHRDDLVWFDVDGNLARTLESAISGQTGDLALETDLAVDGLGNVYALSEFDREVFKFSAQGKFVDRFGVQGNDPSHSQLIDCIAVDGQGRVYVGGSYEISIFSPEGRYILSFETEDSVRKMAFSLQGDLYIVSGDAFSRYQLGELP
jgi:DNA-directed RNA polymerase subunit RPC12/RpoP